MRSKKFFFIFLSAAVLSLLLIFPDETMCSSQKPPRNMPAAVKAVLYKAGILIDQKKYTQAREVLTAFQAKVPPEETKRREGSVYHHAEIYFSIGTCLLLEKEFHHAIEYFQEAVNKDPAHVYGWLNLATSAYETNNYSLAASGFAHAYEADPEKNPEHLYHSGVALMLNEDYEKAVTTFELVFSRYPEKIQTCWRENMANALLILDRALAALPHIEIIIDQSDDTKKVKWQEILLYQYIQLGMKDRALTFALQLIEQDPTQEKWWNGLVRLYMEQGDYASTLSSLITLSHLKELSDEEERLMADLHMQLGIPASAIKIYKDIVDKKPLEILPNMLAALQQTGKYREALELLEFYAPDERSDTFLLQKGDLLFSLERFTEAADCYQKVACSDKKNSKRAKEMENYARLLAQKQ